MAEYVICRAEGIPPSPAEFLPVDCRPRWLSNVVRWDARRQRYEYRALAPFGLVDARAFEILRSSGQWSVTFEHDNCGTIVVIEPLLKGHVVEWT